MRNKVYPFSMRCCWDFHLAAITARIYWQALLHQIYQDNFRRQSRLRNDINYVFTATQA